jgi:1,4-alpha-glucan branching enzyme
MITVLVLAQIANAADFRLYAPRASAVSVVGDFGGPLALSRNGEVFTGTVSGAHDGQKYHFVVTSNGVSQNVPDPDARARDGAESVLVDPAYSWTDAGFVRPPLSSATIYELHVGSFAPPAGQWGTYPTVSAKLDYLRELGVSYVELLPLQDSARPFDWGYGVSLPNTLEPTYGSPAELRDLVNAAHARGIGVLLDVVHNHYSGHTALSPDWFYSGPHGVTRWGPRPDFGNAETRALVSGGIARWVREYHVDGFRWDAAPYIANFFDFDPATKKETMDGPNADGVSLLKEINSSQPALVKIAEWFGADASVTAPVSQGGIGFDAHWNGLFSVIDAVTASDVSKIDLGKVAANLAGPENRVIFTESHDEVGHPPRQRRIPMRIDGGNPESVAALKRSLLGAALTLTAPGVSMLMQGQEFAESQDFAFPTGTPLDWAKAARLSGITRAYGDLIHLRRELAGPAVVFHRNDTANVLAFTRAGKIILVNFGAKSFPSYLLGAPSGGEWKVRFSSDGKAYNVGFGGLPVKRELMAKLVSRDGLPATLEVELPAFSALVLEH